MDSGEELQKTPDLEAKLERQEGVIKTQRNIIFGMVAAIALGAVGVVTNKLDRLGKSTAMSAVRQMSKENANLTMKNVDLWNEASSLRTDLELAKIELDSLKERSDVTDNLINKQNAYIESLVQRIKELEQKMRDAGLEFAPTDWDAIEAATADVE